MLYVYKLKIFFIGQKKPHKYKYYSFFRIFERKTNTVYIRILVGYGEKFLINEK